MRYFYWSTGALLRDSIIPMTIMIVGRDEERCGMVMGRTSIKFIFDAINAAIEGANAAAKTRQQHILIIEYV